VSELLELAIRALGPAASKPEIKMVAGALRSSGDAEALAVFGLPADGTTDPDPAFDHEACRRVQEIAVEVGAGALTGLDLYAWTVNPTWDTFPAYDDDEAALREATS
jgi:hypothetical protein